jgi:nicotinamidase-related amidase
VILTGVTADICVLFTANEAYMRDYNLFVPSDCVAAVAEEDKAYALRQMAKVLKADIGPSSELDLKSLGTSTAPGARPRP